MGDRNPNDPSSAVGANHHCTVGYFFGGISFFGGKGLDFLVVCWHLLVGEKGDRSPLQTGSNPGLFQSYDFLLCFPSFGMVAEKYKTSRILGSGLAFLVVCWSEEGVSREKSLVVGVGVRNPWKTGNPGFVAAPNHLRLLWPLSNPTQKQPYLPQLRNMYIICCPI